MGPKWPKDQFRKDPKTMIDHLHVGTDAQISANLMQPPFWQRTDAKAYK